MKMIDGGERTGALGTVDMSGVWNSPQYWWDSDAPRR